MKVLFLMLVFVTSYCSAQNTTPSISKLQIKPPSDKIIIELHATPDYFNNRRFPNSVQPDSIELQSVPFDYIGISPEWDRTVEKITDGKIKWTISAEKPLLITSRVLGTGFIFQPGDSVRITYADNIPTISGSGEDAFKLQSDLLKIQGMKGPTKHPLLYNSVETYFDWITHLNKKLDLLLPLLQSYEDKVSPFVFNYVKQLNADWLEVDRTSAFNALYILKAGSKIDLTFTDLSNIWDSTQSNAPLGQWLRSQSSYYASGYYLYDYNRLDLRRKYDFDFTIDTLTQKKLRVQKYYDHAKTTYKGNVREKLLQYLIAEEIITEVGPTDSLTINILADYQTLPNKPEYINWMNEYLEKRLTLRTGKRAPDFTLTDRIGKNFKKNDLKGKIALLDFWFTGCTGCIQMTPALKKIEHIFKNDSNVVFVSISTDKERRLWEKSIQEGRYTTGNAINLYTGGMGDNHTMLRQFNISGYPELILMNAEGKILVNPVPDPRSVTGMQDLVNLIKHESSKLATLTYDGPYISYIQNEISDHTIENNILTEKQISSKATASISVKTDQADEFFKVKLKSQLQAEKSEYNKPNKIFAVSDIEGQFESFRMLLQNNDVIDKNFNWTFSKGHLVIAGDVFDRGTQVTECLWLIYHLEEKAKAAGGYVHFILGNHEIMNLKGDHKYTIQKYKDNANKIGKSLVQLYNENSELGRWLRTKNIIEKIGNLLFVHAGIAPEINRMPLSIDKINDLARPYYAAANLYTSDKNLLSLFNDRFEGGRDRTAPFWFRGYYGDADNAAHIPTTSQLDSTLQKFGVGRVITGHTIVADTVSLFYNGKVINLDTPHAEGKSEALLIEGNMYFRVNKEGRKVPLPIFDTSRINTPPSSK